MASDRITIRVEPELKQWFEQQAKRKDRSVGYMVTESMEQTKRASEARDQMIRDAMAEADKGVFVSEEAVQKWMGQQNVAQKNTTVLLESLAQPEERQRIVVKKGSNIVILPIHTVHYIEAFDDYVKVHTKEGFYLKKKTMSHYETTLDPSQFVRIHRSFLLNLQELTRIEPMEKDNHVALLKSGVRVPLSQSGYVKLKEVLGI